MVGEVAKPWGIRDDFWGIAHPYSWGPWKKILSIRDKFEALPTPSPDYTGSVNYFVEPRFFALHLVYQDPSFKLSKQQSTIFFWFSTLRETLMI